MVLSEGTTEKNPPVTPPGIDPRTVPQDNNTRYNPLIEQLLLNVQHEQYTKLICVTILTTF